MTAIFGSKPHPMELHLSEHDDFVDVIENEITDWPTTAKITLVIKTTTGAKVEWVATISGKDAAWNVDADAVAAVLASKPARAYVLYENEGFERKIFSGSVKNV